MRTVGKRKVRRISVKASGELLKQGALFNDEIHKLPTGKTTYMPKGIYRYSSQQEANEHWEKCMLKGMANNARR